MVPLLEDKCVAYIMFAHEFRAKKKSYALNGREVPFISGCESLNVQFAKRRGRKLPLEKIHKSPVTPQEVCSSGGSRKKQLWQPAEDEISDEEFA